MAAVSYVTASVKTPQHTGQYGDASIVSGRLDGSQAALGLSASSDVVTVDLATIRGGTEVYAWRLKWSALGTAASGKLGFRYVDPARAAKEPGYGTASKGYPTPAIDYFLTATSMASAGNTSDILFAPVKFELPVVLTLTVDTSSGTNIIPAAATVTALFDVKAKGSL